LPTQRLLAEILRWPSIKVAPDLGGLALLKRVTQRLRKAIAGMLESAPDTRISPDEFAIQMMLAAMSGAIRSVLLSVFAHRWTGNLIGDKSHAYPDLRL
jgi:hypothetical protein